MRIVLYGETEHKGSGAWSYAKAIANMGYSLSTFQNDFQIERYKYSFLLRCLRKLNSGQILEYHRKRHVNELIKLVRECKPDIVIILKGLLFTHSDIKEIKKHSPFVVNINHDDFFSLNRNNRSRIQFASIPFYDYIFVTRPVNVEEVRKYNRNTELFLFSYDPDIHNRQVLLTADIDKYNCDVLFIGTYEKQRAALMEAAFKNTSINLAIYGHGWRKLPSSYALNKSVRSDKGLWMDEMAKAIGASKVTLGFLRKENRDEYTQRSFEIPASGGVLLAERTNFHERLYKENEEAFFFDPQNPNELREKAEMLVCNQELREKVREKTYHKVINGRFTYEDRVKQLIDRFHEFKR